MQDFHTSFVNTEEQSLDGTEVKWMIIKLKKKRCKTCIYQHKKVAKPIMFKLFLPEIYVLPDSVV